jgi:hypothetical protein
MLLGVPIGRKQFRFDRVNADISGVIDSTEQIYSLDSMDSFVLLNYCINSVPVFLKRSVDMERINEIFRKFDDHVDAELFRIIHTDFQSSDEIDKKRVRNVRTLPRRLGGLGLISHSGGAGEKNVLSARMSLCNFIAKFFNGMRVADDYFSGLDLVQYSDGTADQIHPAELLQRHYAAQSHNLLEELAHRPEDRWFSAWFRSNQFKGSGKWLEPLPLHLRRLRLRNLETVCNLRARLGFAPITEDMLCPTSQHMGPLNPNFLRRPVSFDSCNCKPPTDSGDRNALHSLDCKDNLGLIDKRHNLVRNILGDLIRKSCSGALVELEPQVIGYAQRPDISIFRNGRQSYIDVVITDPSCPSHLDVNRSHLIADAANNAKERIKLRHYQQWTDPVIPFAVEATGRLGPSALKFIKSITQQMGKSRAIYLQQIQCAIAKFNAEMFTKTVRGLRMSGYGVQYHVF